MKRFISIIFIKFVLFSAIPSYGTVNDPILSSTDDTLDLDILDDIVVKPSDCKDKHSCIEELCEEIKIVPKVFENPAIFGGFNGSKCEITLGLRHYLNIPELKDTYKQEELKDLMDDLWDGGDAVSWQKSASQCHLLHEIKHATQTYCETGAFNKNEKEAYLDSASCLTHHADKFEDASEDSKTLWDAALENFVIAHYNECLEVYDLPSIKDCEECALKHIVGKLEKPLEEQRDLIQEVHKLYCPAVRYGYACVEEDK